MRDSGLQRGRGRGPACTAVGSCAPPAATPATALLWSHPASLLELTSATLTRHVAGSRSSSEAMMGGAYGLWLTRGCTHDQLYLGRRLRFGLWLWLKYWFLQDLDGCWGNLHLWLRGRGRSRGLGLGFGWNNRGRSHDWRGCGWGHDGLQVSEATQ